MADRPLSAPMPPGVRDPLIQMRGITKVFKSSAGEFTVLKGIDVDIYPGEFVSVVGRSGSGKSTLVNMLTGIDHPTQGTVQVQGILTSHMPESRMALWRGKTLGIVFQFFQLLPMLTLAENVMLPMDFCNIYPPASREERALHLLGLVGLQHLAHKLPGEISGGQQQSAAVARALANDPPILIADEPTGNLDTRTAEEVMVLFEDLVKAGKTILMVTHDRSLASRTTRTLLISDGEMVHEAVARAFPDLPHHILLQISRLARPVHLAAGEALPVCGTRECPVYIIAQGDIELARSLPGGGEDTSNRLVFGQYLDPLAHPKVTSRPAGGPAELLALNRDEVLPLIAGALPPLAARALTHPEPARTSPFHRWLSRERKLK